MGYELDLIEVGPRPALALQYVVAVQVGMWRASYDWRLPHWDYVGF